MNIQTTRQDLHCNYPGKLVAEDAHNTLLPGFSSWLGSTTATTRAAHTVEQAPGNISYRERQRIY